MSIKDSIVQFGLFNSFKRLLKKAFKLIGLKWETYYLLHRDLKGEIRTFYKLDGLNVKKLTYDDFRNSEFYRIYSQSKKILYRKRFLDSAYQAFGALMNDSLVYLTWIATEYIRIENIHFEQKIGRDEGFLLDSFTLPEARGLGIHKFMNGYRLQLMKNSGIKRAFAAVFVENVPALKTQRKHGFSQGEKILFIKIGKRKKYYRKKVSFAGI